MNKLLKQSIQFIGISGIGWLIDFSIFNFLTLVMSEVALCNVISSLVAVSFVFAVSTKKVFVQNSREISLRLKFIIYVAYQLLLIAGVSILLAFIDNQIVVILSGIGIAAFSAMLAKILVTPITMVLNFCVMKCLVEKL